MKKWKLFIPGAAVFALFALFTWSLGFVDVRPVGPMDSCVAYAGVNKAVHGFFGVNRLLYTLTDWAGVIAIAVARGFAAMGLAQWIRRRRICRVDGGILLLGAFYIFVFGAYAFFEMKVVNRRPILIGGILEASYPSSTTMLAMCVMPAAMLQFRRLIKRPWLMKAVNILCGAFTAFMVIGRLLCGAHWLTDILGGAMFSLSAVLIYRAALKCLE
ncbi:MAG: phosphatase PAP2 family protein [Clostridia bacterium]|nr:phosphatase PAP2 family protein [Clostridia bacterium]